MSPDQRQIGEARGYLEEADALLVEAINLVQDAYQAVPGAVGERIRQVKANLEIARGWRARVLGGAMFTLQDSIDELIDLDGVDDE